VLAHLALGSRQRREWSAVLLVAGLVGCASRTEGPRSGGGGAGGASIGGTGGAATTGTGGAAPVVGDTVTFSPPSGTFQGELAVTLSTTRAGAEIRYTTDGQPPTASSTLYGGTAVRVTATTQIRAQLVAGGAAVGLPATGLYVARDFDVSGDLPLVLIDAYGRGALSRTDRSYVDAAFMTFGLDASGMARLSAPPAVATRSGIHIRGQSSSSFAKTPYRVELRDGADADSDLAVLGMPPEADWVLNGPFPDKALIRNAFVYALGRDMGMTAPRFVFVELYLNVASRPLATGDYLGVYLFLETIKNQKSRLDLKQLGPVDLALPALTGGYIFKFETLAAEEPILPCTGAAATCWEDLELVDPEPVQAEQRAYITGHIQAFHDVLHTAGFADPATGYAAYIDIPSFADNVIIQELTRSMDAYVRSAYFHKDRDGKIISGPLWDYDLTFDTGGFFQNRSLQGWQYEQSAMRGCNDWFQRLLADPAFVTRVATRWKELRQGLLSNAQVDARIDGLTAGLTAGAGRNFTRWPNLTAARVGPFNTPTFPTWREHVENMRTWIKGRMAWLDTQWQ
jgi:hypothetical protein